MRQKLQRHAGDLTILGGLIIVISGLVQLAGLPLTLIVAGVAVTAYGVAMDLRQ